MSGNTAAVPKLLSSFLALLLVILVASSCTLNREHAPRTFAQATGGEALERIFWKEIAARNWGEVEGALASNYIGLGPSGTLDRAAALDQYRSWQLKSYSLGDLQSEMNGDTFVIAYTTTLNGNAGSQPLPSTPQHMMSVWQQQKSGWVIIAHTVNQ
jgi:hypothetical protein